MLVEPGSLCWASGRMVEARDGKTWAVEFARFSALSAVVRDDGSGLGKGLKLERARRRQENQPNLEDSLDVFHTVREGNRALRKIWAQPPAPWSMPRRPRRSWTEWAVREHRKRVTPHRQVGCGVRPSSFGIRQWPPRRPGS